MTEPNEEEAVDVEVAIDEVGFGLAHIIVYIIVGLFTAADSIEVGFLSYVTEVLKEPWGLTAFDESLMEAMVFLGQIIGAPIWGFLADSYGRRPVFLASAALITAFGIITAFTNGKVSLTIVRFVVGFGVAGLSVPFDIYAEMLPSHLRGKVLMSTFFWFTVGSLYTTWAGWFAICSHGWRYFTVLCAVPTAIASVAGVFLLPESSHWLASKHRTKEAAEVVNKIAKQNSSDIRYKELMVPAVLENLRTRDLWTHSKLRRPFISMCLVWIGFGVGFYGISLMLPHLFKEAATETSARLLASTDKCVEFNFIKIAQGNAGQLLGLLFGITFIDIWGRKPVQQISYGVSGIIALGLGFPKVFGKDVITAIAAVALAAQMAGSCCTWTHTPELFPTNVRGSANSICNACARFGAAISTFIIGDLIPVLPTALLLSGFCFLSAGAVTFVKETAGASLDEQDLESSDEESSDDEDELGKPAHS